MDQIQDNKLCINLGGGTGQGIHESLFPCVVRFCILSDPVLSEASMRFTQETAYHVAQRLLDWGLIADVEGQSIRGI